MSQTCSPDAKVVAILSWSSDHGTKSYDTVAPFAFCQSAKAVSENFAAPGGAGSGGRGANTLRALSCAAAECNPSGHVRPTADPAAAVCNNRLRVNNGRYFIPFLPSEFLACFSAAQFPGSKIKEKRRYTFSCGRTT